MEQPTAHKPSFTPEEVEHLRRVVKEFSPTSNPVLKEALDKIDPEARKVVVEGTNGTLEAVAALTGYIRSFVALQVNPEVGLAGIQDLIYPFTTALMEFGTMVETSKGVTDAVNQEWGSDRYHYLREELAGCKRHLVKAMLAELIEGFQSWAWFQQLHTTDEGPETENDS